MGGERDGQDRSGRPAEQKRDRMGEQRAGPAEVSPYVAVAVELSVCLGGECTGEEDPEQQQDDAADLPGECGARRLIVPGLVRAS